MKEQEPDDPKIESLLDLGSEAELHELLAKGVDEVTNEEMELIQRLFESKVAKKSPPADLKDSILTICDEKEPSTEAAEQQPKSSGVTVIRPSEDDWINFPVKQGKVRLKVLAEESSRGVHTFLLHCEPQSFFPEHKHLEFEHLYVLEGDFQTEGMTLGAGDFLRFGPGDHHGESYSESGCRVILVAPTSSLYSKKGYQGISAFLGLKKYVESLLGR
ncbi:MAG: cupin domain-containing protein [Verrucomicrobiota bacterium]